jgi:hypothetical protein
LPDPDRGNLPLLDPFAYGKGVQSKLMGRFADAQQLGFVLFHPAENLPTDI